MSLKNNESLSRKGIYLLPNLFTTGALFAGFYAIVAAMDQQFVAAAVAVVVAGILDGLDGRVARLTGTQSEFGVQYDSLSDLVSFGLAPSLVVYNWALVDLKESSQMLGKLGWLAAFVYAACAALRLARFNTQVKVADKNYFQGLASPAAAGLMVSMVWVVEELGLDGGEMRFVALAVTLIVGLLMVSNFRYYSFKVWPKTDKVPFVWILMLVLAFVLLAIDPPWVLLIFSTVYVFSGPVMTILGRRKRRAG